MSEGMSETDREKILLGEVKRFKKLKEDIAQRRAIRAKEKRRILRVYHIERLETALEA